MSEAKNIRESVSRHYAKAVKALRPCCGEGLAAKIAGYREQDTHGLPADAVEHAFGCGNPLAFSGVSRGETVLDLGCGAGIDLLIAAEKVGATGKVIGVDMTDEMVEKARRNVAKAGLDNVEVRKGIIEELPVESGSVDLVVSNCVINLSPEKEKVFAEIARVLKPGGRMQVSDIVAQDLPEWVLESMEMYAGCVAGAISEDAYLEGLRRAGLEGVEVLDRLVYERSQLKAILGSDGGCGCGSALPEQVADTVFSELEGKVWSAQFRAMRSM